jgi:hypothetical protein
MRSGRKSAAQTPAPKKDRIYGSKTNPKGSASSEKSAKSIVLSDKTMKSLQGKLKEFKEKHPAKKNITLNDLKAVYRRGLGAYSSSHRPTITGGVPNTRNAWAMARVNKFLLKAGGTKVKAAYVQDDDLMKYSEGGSLYAFSVVIKNIKNPNDSYKSVKNMYRGAYAKIFDILDEDSIFTQWETEEEKLEGNDLYLYFSNKPDSDKVEKISKIPNVQIIESGILTAPNGKPSNLTPEQYKLVRTPEFKAWFGDWENSPETASKVVDENGEPLVVYHGTRNEFFTFDSSKTGTKTFNKQGFYFSSNFNVANSYLYEDSYGANIKHSGFIIKCFLDRKSTRLNSSHATY